LGSRRGATAQRPSGNQESTLGQLTPAPRSRCDRRQEILHPRIQMISEKWNNKRLQPILISQLDLLDIDILWKTFEAFSWNCR
jgi:hypothetical protein